MQLEEPDFTQMVHLFATTFKGKVHNNHFRVNPTLGKGYFWTEQLPFGITVMVSDTSLHQQLSVDRCEEQQHFFVLQFNEEVSDDNGAVVKGRRSNVDFQSYVKLSHTLLPETFDFPTAKRLRSVKFFFNKDHLSALLGKAAVEDMMDKHFPAEMKNVHLEPIATEYRVMLDDLWAEKINEPLRLNYIQNRVLLLLEKYILKLHERRHLTGKKSRRNEDETMRLMKVEALLVKNFTVAPPTINELSRLSAMSPTKLKNDFKQLYGLPVYGYFQKNRMLKAKSLLVLGRYTIREVGMQVGYSNLSHFADSFKKEFGFLPSDITAKDGMLVYSK